MLFPCEWQAEGGCGGNLGSIYEQEQEEGCLLEHVIDGGGVTVDGGQNQISPIGHWGGGGGGRLIANDNRTIHCMLTGKILALVPQAHAYGLIPSVGWPLY